MKPIKERAITHYSRVASQRYDDMHELVYEVTLLCGTCRRDGLRVTASRLTFGMMVGSSWSTSLSSESLVGDVLFEPGV